MYVRLNCLRLTSIFEVVLLGSEDKSSFDLSNNLSLRVWELFTEEIYFTDSLCTMKHLLLPAQVEEDCLRQRLTEYVLVPLKHKEEQYLLIVH